MWHLMSRTCQLAVKWQNHITGKGKRVTSANPPTREWHACQVSALVFTIVLNLYPSCPGDFVAWLTTYSPGYPTSLVKILTSYCWLLCLASCPRFLGLEQILLTPPADGRASAKANTDHILCIFVFTWIMRQVIGVCTPTDTQWYAFALPT